MKIYINRDKYDKQVDAILNEIASGIQESFATMIADYDVEAYIDGLYYNFGNVLEFKFFGEIDEIKTRLLEIKNGVDSKRRKTILFEDHVNRMSVPSYATDNFEVVFANR